METQEQANTEVTVNNHDQGDKLVEVVVPDTHEVKPVDAKSIVAIVIPLIALFNAIAPSFGWDIFPFSNDQVSIGISAIVAVGTTLWAWFRNNAVTSYGAKKQAVGKQALGSRKEYNENKKEG